jgi:hypothetical protein
MPVVLSTSSFFVVKVRIFVKSNTLRVSGRPGKRTSSVDRKVPAGAPVTGPVNFRVFGFSSISIWEGKEVAAHGLATGLCG